MLSLFLILLASALAAAGARHARLAAQLAAASGGSAGLLAACWITAALASGLAAWGGGLVAPLLSEAGKAMFAAAALAMAAIELAWPLRSGAPREPTRSLGAIALVLFAGQVTDAARFLVLALSVVTGNAMLVAIGGAIGSGAALTLAWSLGAKWEAKLPLGAIRLGLAGVFVIAALVAGWTVREVIG